MDKWDKCDLGWAWKQKSVSQGVIADLPKKNKRQHRAFGKKERRWKLCFASGEKFYRSKAWRALRRQVLRTYGYRCMLCGAVDVEMHVDHIKPRSRFPWLSLKFSNLQVLCRDCNIEKLHHHCEDYREKAAVEEADFRTLLELRERGI